MTIDNALILRLEHLARLELSADERADIITDLNDILAMVEKLQALDTEGVEPLVYVNEVANVWREDDIKGQIATAEALRNAPDHDDTYFKVPKVIDL